jgi:DNA polymerase-3 subunit alpha
MTEKDISSFLKKKIKDVNENEKEYLRSEIRAFKVQNSYPKIIEFLDKKIKFKTNKKNILSFYLLGLAPYPPKLKHRWLLSDMADIDLDFSPEGREKIKKYLKEKYGEENCVSIGTYGTLGVKTAFQDIARVLGVKPSEYLPLSKEMAAEDKELTIEEMAKKYPKFGKFLKEHNEVEEVLPVLVGMKRNIGQHAGGFVVSSDNVFKHLPIVKTNKGYVTGWQESGAIKELEATGFIKIDILGLACVEQIRRCVKEVLKNNEDENISEDPYLLNLEDEKVYEFVNSLQLENVFQMESKVFKDSVKKIKPKNLDDISNISTLVRPGSAEVDDYNEMKSKTRTEPKCVKEIYDRTRGLMIYQEQLMQILMVLGKFNVFEADKVRRLVRKIGKEKTSDENRKLMVEEAEKYHNKYIDKAIELIHEEDGWPKEKAKKYAEDQWNMIMAQANYAFNMPHSYAYSLMGYVQAYLKCYYPVEFWSSTLNTIDRGQEKHGQSSLGKYINYIIKSKINFLPPDVNNSEIEFVGRDKKIYFGLSYIKSVASGADKVIEHRPYEDWEDFLEKAIKNKFNKRVIKSLIFSGATEFGDYKEERARKYIDFLEAKSKKKNKEEIEEYEQFINGSDSLIYELSRIEYDLLKYSFTGIDKSNLKYKQPLISERDPLSKSWCLIGFVSNMQMKKSKKSGNQYLLLTLTDFRDSIGVFVFGDYIKTIQEKLKKGNLVKASIKNDSSWYKLPWESECKSKFPVEIIS